MANSFRSENISLFRISIFVLINLKFKNPVLFLLTVVYFLFRNRKEFPVFGLLSLFLFLSNQYQSDLIPIGIVDHRQGSYVYIDKLFYQTKVLNGDDLMIGDIVRFEKGFLKNEYDSQIRKNILYVSKGNYRKIGELKLRRSIRRKISQFEPEIAASLNRILYNEYQNDLSFDLGYGLFSYYVFSKIRKRSPKLCLFVLGLYSILFLFEVKYFIIISDCISDLMKMKKDDATAIKILFFAFLNISLFENMSILFPLVISVFSLFDLNISFKSLMMILTAFFFHETDLITLLFFDQMMKFRIILFILSVLTLFCPILSKPYLFMIRSFSYLKNLIPVIRAPFSFITLVLFVIIRKGHEKLDILILLGLLLLPISDPFFKVSFIDVGQGDAIMIRYPFSYSCVLIDTGSVYNYQKLKKELYGNNIYQIDHLIITHDDSDHNGNVENLKKDFRIKDIITQGKDFEYRKLFFDHLKLNEYDNDNDNSLVYYLGVKGIDFLFTGDISSEAERDLVRRYGPLDVDILKVSHHGSKTATSPFFVSSVLPKIAVISTSGMYDHPSKEVLETLNRYMVRIFSTKESSTVTVYFTGLFSFVKTGKNEFVIIS